MESESCRPTGFQEFPKWIVGPDGPEIVPNAEAERRRLGLAALWQAERGKPIEQRQWFRLGDLADKLARDPRTLTSDSALRGLIVDELVASCRRTVTGGEVAILSDDPPPFEPLTSLHAYPHNLVEALRLGRELVRRFLEVHISLPGAGPLRWRLAGDRAALDGSAAENRQPPNLTLEKNLWDWASQIARDHGENYTRVCASLLSDVIAGSLVTSPPCTEGKRQSLRDTDALGKIRGRRRLWISDDPQYPGYWLTGLIVGQEDINRWLAARGAAAAPAADQAAGQAPTASGEMASIDLRPAPGPKGGEQSIDRLAWQIALGILKSADAPARGHGRLASLARMVNADIANRGPQRRDDSIRKTIGRSLRDWEEKNSEK